ncbi:MAG TPA: tetratricopeptide repeat protein, partial [Bacteroidia bacterium]|nr:tetratricopeptide repeat protein [Bacteroidia bacterium]
SGFLGAQIEMQDSLWQLYADKTKPDTLRLKAIDDIAWSYVHTKPDSAIILSELQLNLANTLPPNIGNRWRSAAFSTTGTSFLNLGNFPKALDYYLKTLKVNEEIGTKRGIGNSYNNIGLVYKEQHNYSKALEYYFKSLKMNEEIGNKQGMSYGLNNIGVIHAEQLNHDKALEYYQKSLKIAEELNERQQMGNCFDCMGNAYSNLSKNTEALNCYFKALELKRETGNDQGRGTCYINLSAMFNKLGDFKSAILYSDSTIQVTQQIGDINNERFAYQNLALAYSKTGRYEEAYGNHVKFKSLTDTIFNTENSKQLSDLKTQFEVEKKETELKAKADTQEIINAVEKKRQRQIIFAVGGVLLLVLIFSFFLYKRFRLTNEQKLIIEEQKILVDNAYEQLHEKNKEVMDSIYYARRIQRSLITSEKYIEKNLTRLLKH